MSGNGQESLSDVREWSGGPSGCLGGVGRPTQMSVSGREAHPDVREWSRVVVSPSWMSGSGREVLPDVREWSGGHSDLREWLEALPDVREYSGSPIECPGGVGRSSRKSAVVRSSSRMTGSDREFFKDVQELSGAPPGCPGVVGRTFRMSGSGR